MELQLRVDGGPLALWINIFQVRRPPVNEFDHVVPDLLKHELEVEGHFEVIELAISLNLVVNVDLLVH